MSDAETAAYLLIAGGLVWVLVGIFGFVRRKGALLLLELVRVDLDT